MEVCLTEPQRIDFTVIIAEIEAALGEGGYSGRHRLSKMMRRQYVQISRMAKSGRCAHYEGEMLLAIHADVCAVKT